MPQFESSCCEASELSRQFCSHKINFAAKKVHASYVSGSLQKTKLDREAAEAQATFAADSFAVQLQTQLDRLIIISLQD